LTDLLAGRGAGGLAARCTRRDAAATATTTWLRACAAAKKWAMAIWLAIRGTTEPGNGRTTGCGANGGRRSAWTVAADGSTMKRETASRS